MPARPSLLASTKDNPQRTMNPLPDKDIKPEEVDEVIRHFGKPISSEHKQRLMEKLEQERERFIEKQHQLSDDPQQSRGRKR